MYGINTRTHIKQTRKIVRVCTDYYPWMWVCCEMASHRVKSNLVGENGENYLLHSSKSILNLTCFSVLSSRVAYSDSLFDSPAQNQTRHSTETLYWADLPATFDSLLDDGRLLFMTDSGGEQPPALQSPVDMPDRVCCCWLS